MLLFGSKEAAVEELRRNCDELWRTQRNSQTLMRIWGAGRRRLTAADLLRRVVAVLCTDSGWCSGRGRRRRGALRRRRSSSGSRVAKGRRRGKGRMRKDLVVPIYKGRLISGREKWGGRKNDYPTTRTPRFSGWSLRKGSVGIRWAKTCINGRWRHGGSPQIRRMMSWRVTKFFYKRRAEGFA